ncbi:MAG: hypothetical protein OER96_07045 [Gammaproteobacteria bacterium]|nr:hypothetical protein [Gammaproteobacteria bacterium]
MKYLNTQFDFGAESGEETGESKQALQARLNALYERERETAPDDGAGRARLQRDQSALLVNLEQGEQAWKLAKQAFDAFVHMELWEDAVQTCDVLFQCDQPGSLSALGQGVWLAVTFPIDPELTVAMLQNIVEETPEDADGAAVAAATAAYVTDLRAKDKQLEDLRFFSMQLMGSVARRHSGIEEQDDFKAWLEKLELNDPAKFLVRLRNVIDVLVQDDWWVDRDAIHAKLPIH